MQLLRRMALFKRLPKFHSLPPEPQELVPEEERSKYPAFATDFETLRQELMPSFCELDNEAVRCQNWYRWMYIILILGGAAATTLAILQIAFLSVGAYGVAGAVVATILGAATAILRGYNFHNRYLNARLLAERLRSEYFLFLGRIGPYTSDQDRVQKLKLRVLEIKQGKEGHDTAA